MRHPKEVQLHLTSAGHRLAAVHHVSSRKRLVICSHGYTGDKTEHLRALVTLARALAKKKISVLRFDFMGSGDSTGDFRDMTPNTEIRDLHNMIRWGRQMGYSEIGLYGLSMGGGVSIVTAAQSKPGSIKCLVTWSAVPDFRWWIHDLKTEPRPVDVAALSGNRFFTDLPSPDVPESYASLTIPKLQVQGTRDMRGFRERFSEYYPDAPGPKKHLVIPDGDHTFSNMAHRKRAQAATVKWFEKYLA